MLGMRTHLVLYPGMEKQGRTLAYSCSSFLKVRLRDLCPLPMGVAIGPFRPTRCFCSSETHHVDLGLLPRTLCLS